MIKFLNRLSPRMFGMMMNIWPPFWASGIRVKFIAADFRTMVVQLKLHWFNRNYVGTHFGGAMFSMADPFFMLILLKNMGQKYIVWDKSAKIEFIKPGKGTLTATFNFTEEEIQQICHQADLDKKFIFDKSAEILNENNEVVARVVKTLYVRPKN